MKIGSKYKIAMRLGASVFPKTQTQKFAIRQEKKMKNKSRGRGPTEYGKQLIEKQKIKMTYGLSERQFRIYVEEANSTHGRAPAEVLHELVERRLDNVVYRLGLAPSRRAARQMVSHGHFLVNGKKTTIPSQRLRVTDVIAVREGSKSAGYFANFAEKFAETPTPSWLSWNVSKMEGGMTALPNRENADPAGDLVAVLSFYSR